jgi:hypothetical protein
LSKWLASVLVVHLVEEFARFSVRWLG